MQAGRGGGRHLECGGVLVFNVSGLSTLGLVSLSVGPSSMRFWAVRKYTAALPDEVDLPLYAEVEVVNMNYSGWWFVR